MREKPKAPETLISAEAQAFAEAARRGVLVLRECLDCGDVHHYPRAHCPLCASRNLGWREASGQGRVYSFTRMAGRRAVAPAMIDLDEGLRLNSVVLDADVHQLAIDDAVTVRFQPDPQGQLRLAFTTPGAEAARAYSARAFAAVDADREGFAAGSAPAEVTTVAVVGAGNMGIGIATAFLKAGFAVLLLDQNADAFDRARARIAETFDRDVQRGRLGADAAAARMAALETATDMTRLADADLVVEAVWEDMALKQQVFADLDRHARPGVCLCTNTSTLDIDAIAAATGRPDRVVGLHFFNPAHVMKLLEVVRGKATSDQTLALATQVGMRLGKVPVVVGNAHGFVGNRLMIAREQEAGRMLLEGALPAQIDAVLTRFGMPMGTFEMQDMAGGIELSYRARQARGEKSPVIDRLFAAGRLGQKTGKGYYRYEPGKQRPLNDPEATAIIEAASAAEGITRRAISDAEIEDRLILPMINEGAKLLAEGIATRAGDIDVVWQTGFGWPEWKGGPMYHADRLGVAEVHRRLTALAEAHGARFTPAPLLAEKAAQGATFTDSESA
ncbi:MAG: OB-fold domain-containing protein [Rhodobacter sp.]|nr:OB-fold domain-containing protein [Paracoccaceae bacterium]MCC0077286.1 OB-fold domain-containing protein [Rhodobacter sp.]